MDYSRLRGFNYQPSWGSSGIEIWRNFDSERMAHELSLGKLYFRGMNSIRLWLSHDAWARDPEEFEIAFDTALAIADRHKLSVMPVLFNRWHCPVLDYGGVYIDHFLPNASWLQRKDLLADFAKAIVGAHATDPRVFSWDLCNEPFFYASPPPEMSDVVKAEFKWLEKMYGIAKECGAKAPVTVGIHAGHGMDGIRQIEPISDILSIHPYWTCDSPEHDKKEFEKLLDDYADFAEASGKPLIASEACWGSTDDAKRVRIIRYSLRELKMRGIGWLAYLLHHSQVADAHRIEFGPLSEPGNLAFIEADGTLRPGHAIFNEF